MDAELTYHEAAETVVMKSFDQFKSQINELFNKPARWKPKKQTKDYASYEAYIEGKKLFIFFDQNSKGVWETLFTVDSELEVTGGGDEIAVFSTVLDVMNDFIEKYEPEKISFEATKSKETRDSSRTKLYDRIIKRFAVSRGYTVTRRKDFIYHVEYLLVKS